ncbi:MAG TPA: glycosyltransferase family 4 protein [Burkholderiales bacterium]|nr:glycosyltransferase family 4 protein [Burkholderiales bacterium]
MRITLVTHYYPAHRGGIELVAAELAKRLAAAHGAEISWHASDCDPAPAIPGVACVPAASCNAVERRLGLPYPLWSPRALRQVARAARAADAVHLHDCLYLPNLAAYSAARRAGRPVLVTQHVGMIPYRSAALRGLLSVAYRQLARRVLESAAQAVFVSESVRRYFESFVRFKSPPLLVANGVDISIFRPADEGKRRALRAELGVAPETPLLLFVGRFVEKKGLPVLRQLAARLAHARWLFAGWGALDPERWQLPNVGVMRNRSGAALAALYQAADLLVLPSTGEGFPLVVQEAMACGTPALVGADTAAGCPDAAGVLLWEDTAGEDVAARWERRIRTLLQPGRPLSAMRPQVACYAAASWSWDACARRYAELFQRCTAR